MSSGFDFLVENLEKRYDHYSARVIAKEALKTTGVEQKDKYDAAELQKLVDALATIGDTLDAVFAGLGVSPTGAPAPPPPAAKEAPAEEKKEEKKDDKKGKKDDKKDEKKDDKKDEKKDDKKDDKKDEKKKKKK